MVRDKYGRKMSKSLGNVIDPQEVISGCDLTTLIKKIEDGNLPPNEVRSLDFVFSLTIGGFGRLRKPPKDRNWIFLMAFLSVVPMPFGSECSPTLCR